MKHLANCDPVEFLVQTNKIRKAASKWLTLTKIMEIRKTLPAPKDSEAANKDAIRKQSKANIERMLESIMGEHPKETAELLGLMCFIEPDDLKNHKAIELVGAYSEMIQAPEVLDFFTSLMPWVKKTISDTPKA